MRCWMYCAQQLRISRDISRMIGVYLWASRHDKCWYGVHRDCPQDDISVPESEVKEYKQSFACTIV
jgi:hypothetical protein